MLLLLLLSLCCAKASCDVCGDEYRESDLCLGFHEVCTECMLWFLTPLSLSRSLYKVPGILF